MIKSRIKYSFLILCMISCQLYNDNGMYRGKRASRYYKKTYKPIDSIKINKIRICKKQNNDINKILITKGELNIRLEHVEQHIMSKLKDNFKYLDYKLYNDTTGSFNCAYLTRRNVFLDNYKIDARSSNKYNLEVTLDLFYTSKRDANIGGFTLGGFHTASMMVLDRDIHFIHHVLRMAIFYKNELIYMDNYIHQKRITSDIDKNVHYEVPLQAIDSLVTGSLSEYYKRLE